MKTFFVVLIGLSVFGCAVPHHKTPVYHPVFEESGNPGDIYDQLRDKKLLAWSEVAGNWRSFKYGTTELTREKTDHVGGYALLIRDDMEFSEGKIAVTLSWEKNPLGDHFTGLVFDYIDPFNYQMIRLCDFNTYQDQIDLFQLVEGERKMDLAKKTLSLNYNQPYRLELLVEGKVVKVLLQEKEVFSYILEKEVEGKVGLMSRETDPNFTDFSLLNKIN